MYPSVTKASDGSENSFCWLCHAIMQPRLSAMVAHEKTKKHQQKVRAAASILLLPVVRTHRVAENVRNTELQLAIFTACHMSFQAVDHLGEVITHNGEGSPLGRIKLHRTKCSKLVTEVAAPALREELREDIKGKKFAVLIWVNRCSISQPLVCGPVLLQWTWGVDFDWIFGPPASGGSNWRGALQCFERKLDQQWLESGGWYQIWLRQGLFHGLGTQLCVVAHQAGVSQLPLGAMHLPLTCFEQCTHFWQATFSSWASSEWNP